VTNSVELCVKKWSPFYVGLSQIVDIQIYVIQTLDLGQ